MRYSTECFSIIQQQQWHRCTLPKDTDIDLAAEWCDKQKSNGKFSMVTPPGRNTIMLFSMKRDLLLFMLRWETV